MGYGWPVKTVYTPYMDRIYRWCTPDLGSIPNSSLFSFVGQFFSHLLYIGHFICFLPLIHACFALINSFIGDHGSWTPFCTSNGHFWVFWAWLLTIYYWVQKIGSCMLSFSRAVDWPPFGQTHHSRPSFVPITNLQIFPLKMILGS